jgi:DNA-3-methyladenine glycosylase II
VIRTITSRNLSLAVTELAERDPDMARISLLVGVPPLRLREPGFGSLIKIICAQQVSTASARAIVGRLEAACEPLEPQWILNTGEDGLRRLGFSRQKATYAMGIADALIAGRIDLDVVARMPDEESIATLTSLKGIGRWTAEVYLLFALRRPDLWPIGDLAIVSAVQRIKGLEERPGRDAMLSYGELWKPLRSVAARMLWHYLNAAPVDNA